MYSQTAFNIGLWFLRPEYREIFERRYECNVRKALIDIISNKYYCRMADRTTAGEFTVPQFHRMVNHFCESLKFKSQDQLRRMIHE